MTCEEKEEKKERARRRKRKIVRTHLAQKKLKRCELRRPEGTFAPRSFIHLVASLKAFLPESSPARCITINAHGKTSLSTCNSISRHEPERVFLRSSSIHFPSSTYDHLTIIDVVFSFPYSPLRTLLAGHELSGAWSD